MSFIKRVPAFSLRAASDDSKFVLICASRLQPIFHLHTRDLSKVPAIAGQVNIANTPKRVIGLIYFSVSLRSNGSER